MRHLWLVERQSLDSIEIKSVVMFCRCCKARRLFKNLRPWTDLKLEIGECASCGNTQAVQKSDPPPAAA